ncbi:MAG: hypothetical protein EXS05_04130 [Planctomycetaceae bacterium]|nr:hypothetical protein [Planctomycetaceae bacterium]
MPADEAAPGLPKDGTWVRYFGTMRREGTTDETALKRTYSLVGTKTENGQVCRWVEMKDVHQVNHKEEPNIFKFLIPEKDLLENKKPLESLVRAWGKFNDGDVQELKFNSPDGLPGDPHSRFGWHLVIFPGPRQQAETLKESRVVDYQHGRLEIPDARLGRYRAMRRARGANFNFTLSMDSTYWCHSDVPLGVAAWKSRLELRQDDMVRPSTQFEFVLEDFGTNAKSALPDHD